MSGGGEGDGGEGNGGGGDGGEGDGGSWGAETLVRGVRMLL